MGQGCGVDIRAYSVSRRCSILIGRYLHGDSGTDVDGVSEEVAEPALVVQAFASRDD